MLGFLTVVIMLIVAYAFFREGVLTAFVMACNVLLAGLVAFDFFEPIANELEPLVDGTFLKGYEDSLCLMVLFCLTLGLLRWATNSLARTHTEFNPVLQQGGAVLCGLFAGYLAAGFLVCVLQTLPWSQNFMGFDARVDPQASGGRMRRVLPPDRVWLALMHRASVNSMAWDEAAPFDPDGSFEFRYQDVRRYPEPQAPQGTTP